MNTFHVVKANGERVPFDPDKIRRSLRRTGASQTLIDEVVDETLPNVTDGMTTRALYRIVYRLLRKEHRTTAGKYHLKRAIFDLGPSGFPFERFVAELLKAEGFETRVGQIVRGRCIEHEIDILAIGNGAHYMVECKFHSNAGRTTDSKDALYTYARFQDVEPTWKKQRGHENITHLPWLFTNTRLSTPARNYGRCMNFHTVSWDYPEGDSLRDRIDRHGTHPVTCLSTLTRQEQDTLLKNDVVLCSTVSEHPEVLRVLKLSKTRRKKVLDESASISSHFPDSE